MVATRALLTLTACAALCGVARAEPVRVLFVGNSFTHGRYLPVRTYRAGFGPGTGHVHDDNCLDPDACARPRTRRRPRPSGTDESGPFGGIPGIFLTLTEEAGLSYDVSINAVSSATLARTADTPDRVRAIAADPLTGRPFDIVVLQEQSFLPLPATNALGQATRGDPVQFTDAVNQLVATINGATRRGAAKVFLYETWPLASYTYSDGPEGRHPYAGAPIAAMAADLHRGYAAAAAQNRAITGVAYAGDAWVAAIDRDIAERDPFAPNQPPGSIDLWDSDSAAACCTTPVGYHPSPYGAYLNALVLFRRITGQDPSRFGPAEKAALQLGLNPAVAAALQQVAATYGARDE